MAMGNMEWIRLAATGGRDPNVQDANCGPGTASKAGTGRSGSGGHPHPDQQRQQNGSHAHDGAAQPARMTAKFQVNYWQSRLDGNGAIRFEVTGPGGFKSASSGYVTVVDGDAEVDGILAPPAHGEMKIWFKQSEDLGGTLKESEVSGSCNFKANASRYVYIAITPEFDEATVTEEDKNSTASIGGGMTTKDSGGAEVSGTLLGIGGKANIGTETSRSGDTRNSTQERNTSRQVTRRTLRDIQCESSEDAPTIRSSVDPTTSAA